LTLDDLPRRSQIISLLSRAVTFFYDNADEATYASPIPQATKHELRNKLVSVLPPMPGTEAECTARASVAEAALELLYYMTPWSVDDDHDVRSYVEAAAAWLDEPDSQGVADVIAQVCYSLSGWAWNALPVMPELFKYGLGDLLRKMLSRYERPPGDAHAVETANAAARAVADLSSSVHARAEWHAALAPCLPLLRAAPAQAACRRSAEAARAVQGALEALMQRLPLWVRLLDYVGAADKFLSRGC
jgi:hypothetical protein